MRVRATIPETGALVCAVGGVVSLGISVLQPLLDWGRGDMRDFGEYLGSGFSIFLPFFLGFLLFGWAVRAKNSAEGS